MGINHSSAGVYVAEKDGSQRLSAATSTVAAIVGEANRGSVGQRTLVTSESEYVSKFDNPVQSVDEGIFSVPLDYTSISKGIAKVFGCEER